MRHGPGRRATDAALQTEGFVLCAEVAPDLELALLGDVGRGRAECRHTKYVYIYIFIFIFIYIYICIYYIYMYKYDSL